MRKKFIQFILAFIFIVGISVASEAATITVGSATGNPGDQVSIPVTIDDTAGRSDCSFSVTFDKTKLQYTGKTLGDMGANLLIASNADINAAGKVQPIVLFASGSPTSGTIVSFKFNIKSSAAAGITPLTIGDLSHGAGSGQCSTWSDVIATYNEYVADMKTWSDVISCYQSYDKSTVVYFGVSGSVNINNTQCTGPTITVGTVNACSAGAQVEVPITINDTAGETYFSFAVYFDKTKLQCTDKPLGSTGDMGASVITASLTDINAAGKVQPIVTLNEGGPTSGTICKLKFSLLSSLSQGSQVSLTISDFVAVNTIFCGENGAVTCPFPTITCAATPSSIVFGNAVVISGNITPPQLASIQVIFTAPSGATITKAASSNSSGQYQLSYTPDAVGTWKVKAKYGTIESNPVSFMVNKANTTLTCIPDPPSILLGGTASISGKLTPYPDPGFDLSGLTISLTITRPGGGVKETLSAVTNQAGQYTLSNYAGFDQEGTWQVKASFAGDEKRYNASTSTTEISVRQYPGYAILIEGKTADGEGLDSHNKTLNKVYNQLLNRGFKDDGIFYFNYNTTQTGIDASPTKSGIEYAITGWAKDKMNKFPAPLYIILVGPNDPDKFYISPDYFFSPELDAWITTLELGLTGNALSQEIMVIYGANYSGSSLDDLSGQGRIIITSAAADEQSYMGPDDPSDGIRDGEYFITELFKELGKEKNFKDAFITATGRTEDFTGNPEKSDANSKNGYFDSAGQHPLLDDNGDTVGSNDLSLADGKVAQQFYLGSGSTTGESVEITAVSPSVTLSPTQTKPALWAKVSDASRVKTIWVEIKPQGYQPPSSTGEIVQDLPTCTSDIYNSALGRYEWSTCSQFTASGTYEVFYFARDSVTEEISPFFKTLVYKEKAANQPPLTFSLLSPQDNADINTTLILDWDDSADPEAEQVKYIVEISEDQSFSNKVNLNFTNGMNAHSTDNVDVLYNKEGIPYSIYGVDSSAGLKDLTKYYWRVKAIDPYGGVRTSSETFSFTSNNTSFIPSLITGYVVDDADNSFISVGEVKTDTGGAGIVVEGYYLMTVPAGICTVTATADGYTSSSVQDVEVTSGETETVNLSLSSAETTWEDVVAKYLCYVSGECIWDEVIATYQAYVTSST